MSKPPSYAKAVALQVARQYFTLALILHFQPQERACRGGKRKQVSLRRA
jgi:hypothetical protein